MPKASLAAFLSTPGLVLIGKEIEDVPLAAAAPTATAGYARYC